MLIMAKLKHAEHAKVHADVCSGKTNTNLNIFSLLEANVSLSFALVA